MNAVKINKSKILSEFNPPYNLNFRHYVDIVHLALILNYKVYH